MTAPSQQPASRSTPQRTRRLAIAFLAAASLAAADTAQAQGAPVKSPNGASPVATAPKQFSSLFLEATPKVELRLRGEFGDQDATPDFGRGSGLAADSDRDESMAWTARARLGLLSGEYLGVQGYLELEHTEAANTDGYNAAPGVHGDSLGPTTKTVIPDPESNELNQAWLSLVSPIGKLKLGRQRITLDEHRFIGNVGWRQNEQTYDAGVLEAKPLTNLDLFYAYVYNVNRIFGSHNGDSPEGSVLRDFDSRSHLVQLTYKTSELATLRSYAFLLDLQRRSGPGSTGDAGSANTYGANLTGVATTGGIKFAYRAEYALQVDAQQARFDYAANYYHLKLSGTKSGVLFGVGREVFGDDRRARDTTASTGRRSALGVGFATPLATEHIYAGFADLFGTTPTNGLVDNYVFTSFALPAKGSLELAFHRFRSNSGGFDYGREIDGILRYPLPWNMTALVKVASYRARDNAQRAGFTAAANPSLRDTLRVIGQIEYRLN